MKLEGILDADASVLLWQKRAELFLEVEIDLSQVTHITSAGYALLVKWAKAVRAQGKVLVLQNVQNEVRQALKLFGIESLFEIK